MLKRKPLRMVCLACIVLFTLVAIFYSRYCFIASVILFILYSKIPVTATMCPRCWKNNSVEPWTRSYPCVACKSSLRREADGWSHVASRKGSL